MEFIESKVEGLTDLLVETSHPEPTSSLADKAWKVVRTLDLTGIIGMGDVFSPSSRKIPSVMSDLSVFNLAAAYVANDVGLGEHETAEFTSAVKHQEQSIVFELSQIRNLLNLASLFEFKGLPLRADGLSSGPIGHALPLFDFTDINSLKLLEIDGAPAVPVSVSEFQSPHYQSKLRTAFDDSDSVVFATDVDDARRGVYSLFGGALEFLASLFKSGQPTGGGSTNKYNPVDFKLDCQNNGEIVDWFFQARYSPKFLGKSTPIKRSMSPGVYKFEARRTNSKPILDSGTHQIDHNNKTASTLDF